jgi:hypothetical protein
MPGEGGQRIHTIGIGDPSEATGCDAGEAPADVVSPAELGLFRNEHAQEGAGNIAKSEECEVIGWNDLFS